MGSVRSSKSSVVSFDQFFAGEWRSPTGGALLESIDPTTEQVIGHFPRADHRDVDEAVAAAKRAAIGWAAVPPRARAERLREFSKAISGAAEELAELDTRDIGSPISAMRADMASAAKQIETFAGYADHLQGRAGQNGERKFAYTIREPFGVVARIIPFNHPAKFAAAKIAAPLLAGNCVLLKPSEHASLSALRIAAIAEDIFPRGVLSVLTGIGHEVGAALVEHPDVPRVAFTGSLAGGQAVLSAAAKNIKDVSLELGAKNPLIVFPDVEVTVAVDAAIKGMNFVRSQGQSCQSTSRVFVHREIHDDFVAMLSNRLRALKVGDPFDEATDMGPLAFGDHFRSVMDLISQGEDEGATLVTGGGRPLDPGYFVEPTLFADVRPEMTIARTEIFGPVLCVLPWEDPNVVIEQANDTPYGLAASIWTNDLEKAHLTAHALDAGYVAINSVVGREPGMPFGGFKQSGLGKESNIDEVIGYTREKVVATHLPESNT